MERLVKDKLYKLQGFPVKKSLRREMTESGNLLSCDQYGAVGDTVDEASAQATRADLAPCRFPPKEVEWNAFHAFVGHTGKDFLAASALSMNLRVTGRIHPCEGFLAAKEIRGPIPQQEPDSELKLGRDYSDMCGPEEMTTKLGSVCNCVSRQPYPVHVAVFLG